MCPLVFNQCMNAYVTLIVYFDGSKVGLSLFTSLPALYQSTNTFMTKAFAINLYAITENDNNNAAS